MNRQVNIELLKKEALTVLNKAKALIENGQLGKACLELKQTVLKAEEIFHITSENEDKEFLLNAYMEMAKYYNKIYHITLDKKDVMPACMYYEKIIYFYEEEIRNKPVDYVKTYRKILESYVQLLWISLEIKDYRLFNKFMPRAYTYAKKLSRKSRTYEDEQYLILICIFRGDYFKIEAKFWFAYFFYFLAMRKMSRIYNKLPQEGIRNDLLLIYEHLSELAKVLKITKQKTKWDNCIKQIKGEIEINE